MKDGNEGSQLNPELWQRLPDEVLESVIAKLPFSRVVAFRRVCKKWYTGIVPRAALHLEASSRSALLYFHYHECKSQHPGSAWWLQVCNSKSGWSGSAEEFQSKSFPVHRGCEYVQLLLCKRGLLFFGFVNREKCIMRDIVVCNPLLSKSKSLGLPRPLQANYFPGWTTRKLFVGVTFDAETGSYCLVSAGVDEKGQHMTLLYTSLTCTWTNGSSFSPALLEVSGDGVKYYGTRSFCCNGNLYWRVLSRLCNPGVNVSYGEYLIRFDSQHGTWSVIPHLSMLCDDKINCSFQGATLKGEIFVWHLHARPLLSNDGPPESLSCEVTNLNPVRPPQPIDWSSRIDYEVEFAPNIKLMPNCMMEKIYGFLQKEHLRRDYFTYDAFSEQNVIYHVIKKFKVVSGLLIFVQDTNVDSYTELPVVPPDRFPASHYSRSENVWSFLASLTSLP